MNNKGIKFEMSLGHQEKNENVGPALPIKVLKYCVYLPGFNHRHKVSIVKKKICVNSRLGKQIFIGCADFFCFLFLPNNSKTFIIQ